MYIQCSYKHTHTHTYVSLPLVLRGRVRVGGVPKALPPIQLNHGASMLARSILNSQDAADATATVPTTTDAAADAATANAATASWQIWGDVRKKWFGLDACMYQKISCFIVGVKRTAKRILCFFGGRDVVCTREMVHGIVWGPVQLGHARQLIADVWPCAPQEPSSILNLQAAINKQRLMGPAGGFMMAGQITWNINQRFI